MELTITRPAGPTGPRTTRTTRLRPTAVALRASVAAVRDALDHMDADALLAVPIGTPHENFEVVEWCARNRKPVINRFDPWPLDHLIVRNTIGHPVASPHATPAGSAGTTQTKTKTKTRTRTGTNAPTHGNHDTTNTPTSDTGTTRSRSSTRRRPLGSLRRRFERGDRPPGAHTMLVAHAITPRTVGSL